MEKKDKVIAVLIGIIVAICSCCFRLEYRSIANNGLTLSSIVLAVYIAAIVGLVNSRLAEKMSKAVALPKGERTQLGVLVQYFKIGCVFSIGTIILSSITLIIPYMQYAKMLHICKLLLSISGLVFYTESLVFLAMIIRFILNRQIWDV